jgi:ABC-type dipeptide/oligopeptide/nickel transport system permease subunit
MIRKRINESPALRKLFGRKMNIIAMSIIGLYLFVFSWILLMQGVALVGDKTGAWDLNKSPIFGALLPGRVLDRVGASNELGFGIDANPTNRMEHISFYVQNVGKKVFEELDQVTEGVERRSDDEIRQSAALAERTLVDAEFPEIREIYLRGEEIIAQQDRLRSLRDQLPQLTIAIEKLDGFRTAYLATEADSEEWEIAAEEVALTIDEILVLIDDYGTHAPENDPIMALELTGFQEAMDAAFDYAPMDPIYQDSDVAALSAAVTEAGPVIDAAVIGTLDDLESIVEELYPMPTGVRGLIYKVRLMLGTDQQGRSILIRGVYSGKVAIQVGVVVSIVAVLFGSLLGAAAGYFGGIMDHAVIWLYSTFSSIPYLVLLVVLAFMFSGTRVDGTLIPLYVAFSLTYWIGPCRVTRGETLKLRSLDYVQAAQVLGASQWRILTRHIIPNTSHLMFINMSLLFIGAIKGEVVLTFLGLGLKEGASWGIMIDQSRAEVVSGFFWQIGAATFFMFVLVLAFNVLTDALQDAFDPKHVG